MRPAWHHALGLHWRCNHSTACARHRAPPFCLLLPDLVQLYDHCQHVPLYFSDLPCLDHACAHSSVPFLGSICAFSWFHLRPFFRSCCVLPWVFLCPARPWPINTLLQGTPLFVLLFTLSCCCAPCLDPASSILCIHPSASRKQRMHDHCCACPPN